MAERNYEIYELPGSKRRVKVPKGKTEEEIVAGLFKLLKTDKFKGEEFDEDRKLLGDQLETSGWGSIIGGTLGSGVGALGFASGPLGLATTVAGGAAGSALGEGAEQWLTGKGDWEDVGEAGIEGGLWSLVPAGSAAAVRAARAAKASKAGQAVATVAGGGLAGSGVGLATGADPLTSGAIGASIPVIGPILARTLGPAVKNLRGAGANDPIKQAEGAWNKIISGSVSRARGIQLGSAQIAAGKQDMKRALINAAWQKFIPNFTKPGVKPPTPAEIMSGTQRASGNTGLYFANGKPITYEYLDSLKQGINEAAEEVAETFFAERVAIAAGTAASGTARALENTEGFNRGGLITRQRIVRKNKGGLIGCSR